MTIKNWIDNTLIVGNQESDPWDTFYLPRNNLFSKKINFGSKSRTKDVKKVTKQIFDKLSKIHQSNYIIANLINCDNVAIYSETVQEFKFSKKLDKVLLTEINKMLNDNRANSSTEWIILLSDKKEWLFLFHLSNKKLNIFGYDNGGILSKIKNL